MGSHILLLKGFLEYNDALHLCNEVQFRFYFGVGGGTSEFIGCSRHCSTVDKVSGRKYQLAVSIDAVYDDGSSNIREILKIMKKECF